MKGEEKFFMNIEKETIIHSLRSWEEQNGVKILAAIENGPRVWGLATPDTGYYVGVVFVRPKEAYEAMKKQTAKERPPQTYFLHLEEGKVQVVFHDLSMVMDHLKEGIPDILEWFASPVMYITTPFWQRLRKKTETYFNERMVIRHFFCRAKNVAAHHLDRPQLASYLYSFLMRSLWCSKYVIENHTFPPTLAFTDLMEMELECDEQTRAALESYQRDYVAGTLSAQIAPIPALSAYVKGEVARQLPIKTGIPVEPVKNPDQKTAYLEMALREAWGNPEGKGSAPASKKKAGRKHAKK